MPQRKHTIASPLASLDQAITSNGHPKRLIALLDYHERAAHAIRTTLELLDADAQKSSNRRIAGTIRAAQGIAAMRHAAKRATATTEHVTPPKIKGEWARRMKAQRQRSAAAIAKLDPIEPRPFSNPKAASVLSLHGFIRKKGSGYVRTAKEFHP